jgi:hypothetical protein
MGSAHEEKTMNFSKLLIPVLLAAIGLGCGYSKPATTPTTMPTITQLSPSDAAAGGVTFPLEVSGMNFASNAVINFNGHALSTTVTSSAKLTASVPASAIMNAGTVPVTVTNPGTSGIYGSPAVTSTAVNFTVN